MMDHQFGLLRGLCLMVLVPVCCGIPLDDNVATTEQCGYQSCNPIKDGMLNVHIIPNTHDDVGWLKTMKQYYDQQVIHILKSVVESLQKDKQVGGDKKFIYVEMAFLKLWWDDIDNTMKDIVKDLINTGRLEITLGSWSMIDEATTYYSDIIDDHTTGFEFIRQNFGECGRPRVGWQIDPFGHSREVASLFSQFGFDGTFLGRIDYQEKLHRQRTKTMEFVWRTSDSLDGRTDIFTGVLANVYWPPSGFCWDAACRDQQLIYMLDEQKQNTVQRFVSTMEQWASDFETDHVMVAMGGDFQYTVADDWFNNLDELIKLTNQKQTDGTGSKVNLLYSTPSCYLYQLNRANRTWSTKSDDFFPYAHRPHSFWTGYYTSRPNFKLLVRKAGAFLQACKQLAALSLLEHSEIDVAYLKEAMGVVQHHDAISGTEKEYVVEDYTRLLYNGMGYCKSVVQNAYNQLIPLDEFVELPDLQFCLDLDIAECSATHLSDMFSVIVYNPLAIGYTYYVRVPVTDQDYKVYNQNGDDIQHQTLEISEETMAIPRRFSRMSGLELVFKVVLPPLGFTTAFVSKYEPDIDFDDIEDFIEEDLVELVEEGIKPDPLITTEEIIENQYYSVSVDRRTGHISNIWNKEEDVALSMGQRFYFYESYKGYNFYPDDQASGAYIFRPTNNPPNRVNDGPVKIVSHKGSQVQEIRQHFCGWVSQVIRLYDDKPYIELEWTVGPLPEKGGGKEVITKYITDLETDGEFYTDLSGRETLKRKRNHRDTWTFNNTEPVSGNYYPITSRASIKDERRGLQLTVLVDRSQGASSIEDGQLEIMIHRRTFYDDSLGLDEPLTEDGPGRHGIVARGKHLLMLNKIQQAAAVYRQTATQLYMQPLLAFGMERDVAEWRGLYRTKWSGMPTSLPANIKLLTLEKWANPLVATDHTAFLLRLEHIFEKFEDIELTEPQLIDLKSLLTPFQVIEAIELTLGANVKKSDVMKLKWKSKDDKTSRLNERILPDNDRSLLVEIAPMEIRTFQINIRVTQ